MPYGLNHIHPLILNKARSIYHNQQVIYLVTEQDEHHFMVKTHDPFLHVTISGSQQLQTMTCPCETHNHICEHIVACLICRENQPTTFTFEQLFEKLSEHDKEVLLKKLLLENTDSLMRLLESLNDQMSNQTSNNSVIHDIKVLKAKRTTNAELRHHIEKWLETEIQETNAIQSLLKLQTFLSEPYVFINKHTDDQTKNLELLHKIQIIYESYLSRYIDQKETQHIEQICHFLVGQFYQRSDFEFTLDLNTLMWMLKLSYHPSVLRKLELIVTDLNVIVMDIERDDDDFMDSTLIEDQYYQFMVEYHLVLNEKDQAIKLMKAHLNDSAIYLRYIQYLLDQKQYESCRIILFKKPKYLDDIQHQKYVIRYYQETHQSEQAIASIQSLLMSNLTLAHYLTYKPYLNDEQVAAILKYHQKETLDPQNIIDILLYEAQYVAIFEVLNRIPKAIKIVYERMPNEYIHALNARYEQYLKQLYAAIRNNQTFDKFMHELKMYEATTHQPIIDWIEKLEAEHNNHKGYMKKMKHQTSWPDPEDELPF